MVGRGDAVYGEPVGPYRRGSQIPVVLKPNIVDRGRRVETVIEIAIGKHERHVEFAVTLAITNGDTLLVIEIVVDLHIKLVRWRVVQDRRAEIVQSELIRSHIGLGIKLQQCLTNGVYVLLRNDVARELWSQT